MTQAIETLMNEHRLIEQVLGALATFSDRVARGGPVERSTVKDFADFFVNFADRCHHGKEEEQLFVAMEAAGMPAQGGPLAVMRFEHDEGRAHVGVLRAIGAGSGPLTGAERSAICTAACGFIPLLHAHIQKEDTILYPMACDMLSPSTLDQLAKQFDTFERDVMGAGEHERFHALADRLIAEYAPAAPPSGALGCPHTTTL